MHTNLRPESVLIDEDGHIVLSDFDNGRFLRGDTASYRTAARLRAPEDEMFHAPELVLGWDHDYGVDWWSFGLILFWIFTRSVGTSVGVLFQPYSPIHFCLQHPFIIEADNVHSAILQSKIIHSKLTEDYPAMDDGAYRLVVRVRLPRFIRPLPTLTKHTVPSKKPSSAYRWRRCKAARILPRSVGFSLSSTTREH